MTEIRSNRKTTMNSMKEYDGFYLLPGEDETEVEYRFFKFNDDKEMGETIRGLGLIQPVLLQELLIEFFLLVIQINLTTVNKSIFDVRSFHIQHITG